MKENYICAVPFTSLEVHDHKRFLCCASWLTKYLPEDSSPKEAWHSAEANEIRDSILDGSYKHCDSNQCPFLDKLKKGSSHAPLYRKDDLPYWLEKTIKNYNRKKDIKPRVVQFSFDRSCNLKCPSCRIKIITASSKKIKEVKATIEEIENDFADSITSLYITGSGDPFISVGFRDFLRNFDRSKYPNIKNIHLHTNATKWNKKMWDSMPNVHGLVKTCEISIDAGTKETYETKTRIGGDWDELIENLKFISTIPSIHNVKPSFVVQKHNYKEMQIFYDLMISIFGDKCRPFYGKINNWGTFSEEEYKFHKVWDKDHPEFDLFIKEVNKLFPSAGAWGNLEEYITRESSYAI